VNGEHTKPVESRTEDQEGNRAFEALADRVTESMRLEKLTDRELVFKVAHSEAADDPAVEEMMYRLWPDWTEAQCPPDCLACKEEMNRG